VRYRTTLPSPLSEHKLHHPIPLFLSAKKSLAFKLLGDFSQSGGRFVGRNSARISGFNLHSRKEGAL
jgi:hypothetical protein